MNRRLVLLNAVLAVVVVYGGVQLRSEYKAAKAREAALRRARITPAPAAALRPAAQRRSGAALGLQRCRA